MAVKCRANGKAHTPGFCHRISGERKPILENLISSFFEQNRFGCALCHSYAVVLPFLRIGFHPLSDCNAWRIRVLIADRNGVSTPHTRVVDRDSSIEADAELNEKSSRREKDQRVMRRRKRSPNQPPPNNSRLNVPGSGAESATPMTTFPCHRTVW